MTHKTRVRKPSKRVNPVELFATEILKDLNEDPEFFVECKATDGGFLKSSRLIEYYGEPYSKVIRALHWLNGQAKISLVTMFDGTFQVYVGPVSPNVNPLSRCSGIQQRILRFVYDTNKLGKVVTSYSGLIHGCNGSSAGIAYNVKSLVNYGLLKQFSFKTDGAGKLVGFCLHLPSPPWLDHHFDH